MTPSKLSILIKEILAIRRFDNLILLTRDLHSIPFGINNLERLKSLSIGQLDAFSSTLRNAKTVPVVIGGAKILEMHGLSDSIIDYYPFDLGILSQIPDEIFEIADLSELTIYTQNSSISVLPKEIWRLKNLSVLTLCDNEITTVSKEISQLTGLIRLDLTKNKLAELPTEIGQLANLKSLYLDNNKLVTLPSEIGNLSSLIELILGQNQLTSLPSEISKLSNLQILYFTDNQVTSLPPEIGQLKNLEVLALMRNKVKVLPDQIGGLTNLKDLDLSGNPIATLPSEIRNLAKLDDLFVEGTLLPIPLEIMMRTKEPQAILNYYFTIIKQLKKPINEIKIIIVGQGSVGKTSLVQQILHDTFDPSQTKTEGISINQWSVDSSLLIVGSEDQQQSTENRQLIKLNIWDFGGQEIMHATHQFFLTKRSLYLLVLDSRLTQEENRVEYWLKIIQSFGGESPVLIVGNKIDQHPLDIDRTGLQKKYPNIVGILETSAANSTGIKELKTAIAEQVNNLPHVRDLLPETWFMVKTKLEEMGKGTNFISHDDYDKLCDNNEVHDEISQHTLIGFLHDLGVVLYFQDDPRLESLGILNPQWVTNGVYKILNSHILFQNKGVLSVSMLDEILNLPEYPRGKRLFIVDMMKKFELCYDIEADKTFLIPDLLPKDEPFTGEWDNALAFQIHYNVLPSSIITRFIVRMNAFIHKTVWRSGVVLKREGNTALVKADMEDRKIYIWVNGKEDTRRDFLSAIRTEFEAIHKTIAKIEATEKVPLPNAPDATPVDLEFLQRLASEGRESLPVQVGNQIVDLIVKEVLSRIEKDGKRNITINIGGDVLGGNIIAGDDNEANIIPPPQKRIGKK